MKNNQTIPDERLNALLNTVFNVWFRKWKSRMEQTSDGDIEAIMAEGLHILEQGEQYPIVTNLVVTFMYELFARKGGEYTETEKNKLLDLIAKQQSREVPD